MTKLIVMVGLPASFKSTYAKQLAKEHNATILSSDDIREELLNDVNNQDNNSKVFEVMNKRAKQLLQKGNNVILDATNINRKRRKHLINHELKMADEKIVYYMNTHVDDCVESDLNRDRSVGKEVIMKMYKSMQIPVKNEGWDEVVIINPEMNEAHEERKTLENIITQNKNYETVMSTLSHYMNDFKKIHELPHDSKYHSFSVSRHTYHVFDYIRDRTDDLRLLWAALFHDVGKGYTKSFINYKGEKTRYASFLGHENISAQIALYALLELGYDTEFATRVSALCQFHMYLMSAGDKKMNEIQEMLGNDLYEDLMILHWADMQAK
ncbi:hypothetical protein CIL05_07570 [Virgibacillus profundi]|uniref:HD domain-containing protein n=1 Tax=Virgibacillus profundi TaxID=2024555 RepID=A0A2A2IGQ1_9BACI|nr:AAA family ATPase [Virgibacillus profundi]PAV30320.1 hypothetical protein CIL05_07570 [Virgibacillus profundi]PXY54492.1 HD domain-containing protein [Virgibacillus profundi]